MFTSKLKQMALRFALVAAKAVEILGDERKAASWLMKPNAYLGGKTPTQMLDTDEGADLALESLHRSRMAALHDRALSASAAPSPAAHADSTRSATA